MVVHDGSLVVVENKDVQSGEFVVPDGIHYIDTGCFSDCTSLVSVIIPNSISYIGEEAFEYCSNLEAVVFPDHADDYDLVIEDYAFQNCPKLKGVRIPENLDVLLCHRSFGFYWDKDACKYSKMNDFTIYGTPGSPAEEYALHYGFHFVPEGYPEEK